MSPFCSYMLKVSTRKANNVGPDQTAFSEAGWSGYTLFGIASVEGSSVERDILSMFMFCISD